MVEAASVRLRLRRGFFAKQEGLSNNAEIILVDSLNRSAAVSALLSLN